MSGSLRLISTALTATFVLVSPLTAGEVHDAALSGNVSRLEKAVAAGENINGQDESGRTALHLAAKAGNTLVTRWLVEMSADPNVLDRHGAPPLIYAAHGGNAEVVGLLISNGSEVRVSDNEGRTALGEAATKKKSLEMIIDMLEEASEPR